MGVTLFSLVLLPFCFVWMASPAKLLQLMIIASIFEAAAALTIGSLGVQPALVPAFGFLAYVALQMLLGVHYRGEANVWRATRPFIIVTVWALASSYIMPRLFEGRAYVWPQKALPPFVLTILSPSSANMNQDIYLLLDCIVLVVAALFLTKTRLPLLPFIRTYYISGFLVAAIAVWQFGSKIAGLPFPSDLFYSNPGWSILTEQSMGAVPRINGPFSEPSSLAGYMAAIVCSTGWVILQGNRDRSITALFIVGLLTMMLSTSTTGFAVLALVSFGISLFALVTGSKRLLSELGRLALPVTAFLGVLFLVGLLAVPGFASNVQLVINASLSKQQSSSYNDRTSTDIDSLRAALDTYGLGVGWGSNRSSSLLPGLLAGVGLPGVAGLIWFGRGVAGEVRKARRLGCSPDQTLVIDACCGALVGFLIAALLSGPTISSEIFYFLLALLIGCAVQVQVEDRSAAFAEPQIDAAISAARTMASR